MDDAVLDRLNSSVAENDILYFLGYFCRGSGREAMAYRKRVRCKNIFFVGGNDDDGARKISAEFRWWKQLAEVKNS
jgi:calcineurin-like phosphoesterase family protein